MEDRDIFRKSLIHAYRHLDQPLTIDDLAKAAGTNVRGLNRAFQAVADTTPIKLVRRLKMETGYRTLMDREASVLEAALSAGFEDHSAFSRSFKRAFGYPPSAGRTKTLLQRELEHVELEQPDFVELVPLTIRSVTAQGYYHDCAARAWAELAKVASGEDADTRVWIGMALDDPHPGIIPEDQVHFTAGVEGVAADLGLEKRVLPGGLHARFRYEGKTANLGLAYHYIYGPWRDSAGVGFAAKPALMMFDEIPADDGVPSRTLIYVPVTAKP
jgi:AraC family transcriptional regulator